MNHTTKLAMLAASLATTLAVAVGAAAFGGSGPAEVSLVERAADDVAEQVATTLPAPATTLAPPTTVPAVAPQTTVAGPTVAPVTTKPVSAAPAPTVAPVATVAPPASTTTTVPAPTWTVRYLDGTTKVLTSAPPTGHLNERPSRISEGDKVDGTKWEVIFCDRYAGPNFRCSEVTAWAGSN